MLSMSGDLLSSPLAHAGSAPIERRTATANVALNRIRNLRCVAGTPRAVNIGLSYRVCKCNLHTRFRRGKREECTAYYFVLRQPVKCVGPGKVVTFPAVE